MLRPEPGFVESRSCTPAVQILYSTPRPDREYGGDVASYGQLCPMSRAMEVLGERWTMLVVRELLAGSHRFNQLRRGLPRMSPSLLSERLKALARAGIVVRLPTEGRGNQYHLTPAGEELGPVVLQLSRWGYRWLPDLAESDLDPALLMWDMCRRIDRDRLSSGRVVVLFRFADVPARTRLWWLVLDPREVEVCEVDLGYDVDVTVDTDLRTMTEVWIGQASLAGTVRTGALRVTGPAGLRRRLPGWLGLGVYGDVERPQSVTA